MPKLKVFRTTVGFHDALVAAPSRAAALRAWGATTDLFGMGAAEEVTDPKLMKRPLADPGIVIKQARGTAADHMAASSTSGPKPKPGPARSTPPSKPKPLPSRDKLDAVEKRVADAEAKLDRAQRELDEEAARLTNRRKTIEHEYQTQIAGLIAKRDQEEELHRHALKQWRAATE